MCRYAGLSSPLPGPHGAYLLVECAGVDDTVTDALAKFLAANGLDDTATAVATEGPGRQHLWAFRERHTEAVNWLGVPHKLDVSAAPRGTGRVRARGARNRRRDLAAAPPSSCGDMPATATSTSTWSGRRRRTTALTTPCCGW